MDKHIEHAKRLAHGSDLDWFQLLQHKAAAKLELLGMRHSSGRSMIARAKRLYGITGNRQKVFDTLKAMVEAMVEERETTTTQKANTPS